MFKINKLCSYFNFVIRNFLILIVQKRERPRQKSLSPKLKTMKQKNYSLKKFFLKN